VKWAADDHWLGGNSAGRWVLATGGGRPTTRTAHIFFRGRGRFALHHCIFTAENWVSGHFGCVKRVFLIEGGEVTA
jgi:hypothetical protein